MRSLLFRSRKDFYIFFFVTLKPVPREMNNDDKITEADIMYNMLLFNKSPTTEGLVAINRDVAKIYFIFVHFSIMFSENAGVYVSGSSLSIFIESVVLLRNYFTHRAEFMM